MPASIWTKRLAPLAIGGAVLALSCPLAHADVGGEVPSPGLCDYPFIGHSEMIGAGPFTNVYSYVCDGPTEINGSHWHAELYGDAVQAALNAGVSIAFFSAGGSLSGNLGALAGSTSWRCPDNTLAEAPSTPGAWKNSIIPAKCKSIGPVPVPLVVPPDSAVGLPAPGNNPLAPVTNPENPNPVATVNPGER